MMRFVTAAAALAVGLAGNASFGAVTLDQSFDDTSVFNGTTTGYVGDATTSGGRWGSFDPTNGPSISTDVAHSGTQSLALFRSSALSMAGRSDHAVADEPFEVSYWIYRPDANSQITIRTANADLTSTTQWELALYFKPDGGVAWHDGSAYQTAAAAGSVPATTWTRVRQAVDPTAGTYDLYLQQEGQAEVHLGTMDPQNDPPTGVDRILFYPQGVDASTTYIDDVLIQNVVPEPASMSLAALGGASVLLRRR